MGPVEILLFLQSVFLFTYEDKILKELVTSVDVPHEECKEVQH